MTKADVVRAVAERTGLTREESQAAVDALGNVVSTALMRREHVRLPGLGTMRVIRHSAKQGYVPSTGERIVRGPRNVVKFKPSNQLRSAV